METTKLIEDWKAFYQRELDMTVHLSPAVPEHQEAFDRLIVIPHGLTLKTVLRGMAERFGLMSHYDVHEVNPDDIVVDNDRIADAKDGYAVWVRDAIDSDQQLANLSANELAESGVKGITLLERLVFELKRFVDTGRHLDIGCTTLCTGSRHRDGSVPAVHWAYPLARVNLHWFFPHIKGNALRSRIVIA